MKSQFNGHTLKTERMHCCTAAVTQADMDAAMDPSPGKEMNTREMSVALQMPDWNAWLPVMHPLDVWTPDVGRATGAYELVGDAGTNPGASFRATWTG